MILNKNKKGYFFILDGLVAIMILVSGFVIIGSIFVSEPIFKPPYNIGEDILLMLSSTNISSLELDRHPGIKQLFIDGKITDNSSSILQQTGKFFYDYCENNNIEGLTNANITVYEVINNIIPHPYYAELNFTKSNSGCTLTHSRIYTSYVPDDDAMIETSKSDSTLLIATQKVVFGNYDETIIFGPYIARLMIWR